MKVLSTKSPVADVANLDIEDIKPGMSVHYTTRITRDEVMRFADLCGDISPLHVDEEFGAASEFGGNILHGALISAHFSTLVGVFLPGRNALLANMNVEFVSPAMVDSEVTVSASVSAVHRTHRAIDLRLLAFVGEEIKARGTARAKIMKPLWPKTGNRGNLASVDP